MCYCGLNSSIIIFANVHRSHPFLHAFYMQEGAWSLYIFSQNHNYQGGTSDFTYKALILAGQQKVLLTYDSLIMQPHKCRVPPELPSLQIAIYFTQTTQPFIIAIASFIAMQLASQLYCTTRITCLAIAIYFAQTTQPFFSLQLRIASYIASQLASYIVPPEIPSS